MSEPVGNGPREPSPRGLIPGNSHKERQEQQSAAEPREKVEKIVTGQATVRKTPWYKRAAQNMIADDATTIGDYILLDVLIPAIKNLIFDIVTQGTGRALYPGGRSGGRTTIRPGGGLGLRGTTGGIREKYNEISSSDNRRTLGREERARHDFTQVTLQSREEAVSVVEELIAMVDRYGSASVSDLYDLCGVTGSYADQRWGWTNLQDANVQQHRGGWLLDLPSPEALRR